MTSRYWNTDVHGSPLFN